MNYPPEQPLYDDPFSPFGNTQVNLYSMELITCPKARLEGNLRGTISTGGED